MHTEIERRFLLSDDTIVTGRKGRQIRQAYFRLLLGWKARIRVVDGQRAILALKSAKIGSRRFEGEVALPLKVASWLLARRSAATVEKTRYEVPFAGKRWEVDVFAGRNRGLRIAEIELDDGRENLALPAWVGREVTNDRAFGNSSLAVAPMSFAA